MVNIVFLSMIKVVLLGTGRVSKHLFDAFTSSKDIEVKQVYGRSYKNLKPFSSSVKTTTQPHEIVAADIYIIAVSDDSISAVSQIVKNKKGLIVHTSGSTPMNALNNSMNKGVLYPLQTFSDHRKTELKEVPFCIETEFSKDYDLLEQLAFSISTKVYRIDSEQRQQLHLAAVFVNNFSNHLYYLGDTICNKANISFDILKPLILETAGKIETVTPFEAQTGPARRQDRGTIKRLEGLLSESIQKDIFTLLTKSIENTYDQKL